MTTPTLFENYVPYPLPWPRVLPHVEPLSTYRRQWALRRPEEGRPAGLCFFDDAFVVNAVPSAQSACCGAVYDGKALPSELHIYEPSCDDACGREGGWEPVLPWFLRWFLQWARIMGSEFFLAWAEAHLECISVATGFYVFRSATGREGLLVGINSVDEADYEAAFDTLVELHFVGLVAGG